MEMYIKKSSNGNFITDKVFILNVTRVNNSVNGSPMYHIYPVSFVMRELNCVDYNRDDYYTVVGYAINSVIVSIFKELHNIVYGDSKCNVIYISDSILNDYGYYKYNYSLNTELY